MSDVHDKWLLLMRRMAITDDLDTLSDERRSRMIVSNAAVAAFLLFCCLRLGTPPGFGNLPDFVLGNTLTNTGNISRLIMLLTIVALLQVAVYRLLVLRYLRSSDMRLIPILRDLQ